MTLDAGSADDADAISVPQEGQHEPALEPLEQAIAWAVRLASGTVPTHERDICDAWRRANPVHEQAWQQVQSVEQAFHSIPDGVGPLALHTLAAAEDMQAKGKRRRAAVKLLGLGVIGSALGALAFRLAPWQQRSDYATDVGQRRSVLLPDGTRLQMNTGTEVRVVFSTLRRLIVLQRGELFIDTGDDAPSIAGRRPFWVETVEARLEAIGTRFGVRQSQGETRLHMIQGQVAVHLASGHRFVANAGDSLVIRVGNATPVRRADDRSFDPAGWTQGVLVAKQMRLDAFVAELSRYQEAPLRCDPAVANLRVSGVFQLEGSDPVGQAIDGLTRTLPVRAVRGQDNVLVVTGPR
ncbi:FecR domain-containing protein [Acidovorax sp. SUPP950]|uniref:FecR domain-containing protein n=1 Tax=Acidovorax sp. SUPP950 TaxID=511901 RepID=UPI0023D048E1|nr:FecR domain-containing protein [Acidovorax sp. SUPP950]GKS77411.1 FecR domain-containing protein [Acidovorax sp. SUPP950]